MNLFLMNETATKYITHIETAIGVESIRKIPA